MSTRCHVAILLFLIMLLIMIESINFPSNERFEFDTEYVMPSPLQPVNVYSNRRLDPQERVFSTNGEFILPSTTAYGKGQFNVPCGSDAECKPPFRFCDPVYNRCSIAYK